MSLRVLVCGGRHYPDEANVWHHLDQLGDVHVIHGACSTGADHFADRWAARRGAPMSVFPANWDRLGRRAGPIRNAEMLLKARPDLVLAFPTPGALNRGTNDMISKARRKGIEVRVL